MTPRDQRQRLFVPPLGWPLAFRAVTVTPADRMPRLIVLNRYPRQIIGIAVRLPDSDGPEPARHRALSPGVVQAGEVVEVTATPPPAEDQIAAVEAVCANYDRINDLVKRSSIGRNPTFIDEIRSALADPDAALARVRAEARAEVLREAATDLRPHPYHSCFKTICSKCSAQRTRIHIANDLRARADREDVR